MHRYRRKVFLTIENPCSKNNVGSFDLQMPHLLSCSHKYVPIRESALLDEFFVSVVLELAHVPNCGATSRDIGDWTHVVVTPPLQMISL